MTISMNNEEEKKSIPDKVLERIKSGQVKMRPRWQFVLRAVLIVVGIVIVLLALLFLASFTLFAMRENGLLFAPLFGFRGWFSFLRSLPWVLVLLAILFVLVLEVLVRRYSFAYRRPLVYTVLGILVVVTLGGVLIFHTPLHDSIFDAARRHREGVPFVGDFYRGFGFERFGDIHRGVITTTTDSGFVIARPGGQTTNIVISSSTKLPLGSLGEGMVVIVFGEEGTTSVQAEAVQVVGREPLSYSDDMQNRLVPPPVHSLVPPVPAR